MKKRSDILSHSEHGEVEYIAAFKEHEGRILNFVVEVDEEQYIARLKFEVVENDQCCELHEYRRAMAVLKDGIETAPRYSMMAGGAA